MLLTDLTGNNFCRLFLWNSILLKFFHKKFSCHIYVNLLCAIVCTISVASFWLIVTWTFFSVVVALFTLNFSISGCFTFYILCSNMCRFFLWGCCFISLMTTFFSFFTTCITARIICCIINTKKTCIFLVYNFLSDIWNVYLLITCRCYLQIFGQIQLSHNKIIGKWHWSNLCIYKWHLHIYNSSI